MKRCPICESFIDDTEMYCPLCKTRHREPNRHLDTFGAQMISTPPSATNSDELTGTLIVGGIFVAVFLLVGLFV